MDEEELTTVRMLIETLASRGHRPILRQEMFDEIWKQMAEENRVIGSFGGAQYRKVRGDMICLGFVHSGLLVQ